ncbi:MAG TPA: universal stress protein [Syntrophales bacterium]|nr:universal stress protein [Syntrophales bacterium]HOL59453.1 universal stress protein [Syntrophales bacterium]HPO34635.1 universal stress protein [Syntrophales bacterium]
MIKTILVPTDGSEYGKTAIEYGIYMARKLGATLVGLHVVDINIIQGPVFTEVCGTMGIPATPEYFPQVEQRLHEQADAILSAFHERCKEARVPAETKKEIGVIEQVIIEEGRKADLIILARRGEHFHLAKGAIMGSTAEIVVRHAGKPVMVTPFKFREIESVGLAYDGSPPAENALRLAIFLCEQLSWPLTTVIVTEDQKYASLLTTKLEEALDSHQINETTVILPGHEGKTLVKFLEDGSVEMLIMGAYGHNLLRRLLGGSTTSYVIRHSPLPVLLTR